MELKPLFLLPQVVVLKCLSQCWQHQVQGGFIKVQGNKQLDDLIDGLIGLTGSNSRAGHHLNGTKVIV